MKTFFKWLGLTSLVIVVAITGFFISMRFHDGPRGIISGGEFQSGDLAVAPDDWTYIKDRALIEFQTMAPATSRVVWLAVDEGKLYILSGYMTTGFGKIWKQWPHYLEADDRVILRIDGKLFEQKLVRQMAPENLAGIFGELERKYGAKLPMDTLSTGYGWLYEVVDR